MFECVWPFCGICTERVKLHWSQIAKKTVKRNKNWNTLLKCLILIAGSWGINKPHIYDIYFWQFKTFDALKYVLLHTINYGFSTVSKKNFDSKTVSLQEYYLNDWWWLQQLIRKVAKSRWTKSKYSIVQIWVQVRGYENFLSRCCCVNEILKSNFIIHSWIYWNKTRIAIPWRSNNIILEGKWQLQWFLSSWLIYVEINSKIS